MERVLEVVRQKYTILEFTLFINLIMCTSEESVSAIDELFVVHYVIAVTLLLIIFIIITTPYTMAA